MRDLTDIDTLCLSQTLKVPSLLIIHEWSNGLIVFDQNSTQSLSWCCLLVAMRTAYMQLLCVSEFTKTTGTGHQGLENRMGVVRRAVSRVTVHF